MAFNLQQYKKRIENSVKLNPADLKRVQALQLAQNRRFAKQLEELRSTSATRHNVATLPKALITSERTRAVDNFGSPRPTPRTKKSVMNQTHFMPFRRSNDSGLASTFVQDLFEPPKTAEGLMIQPTYYSRDRKAKKELNYLSPPEIKLKQKSR